MEPTVVANTTASTPAVKDRGDSGTEKMLIGLIVGLVVGGGGGWYVGNMMAVNQAAMEDQSAMQQTMPAGAAVDASANPLQDVDTNPYSDVKVNPFE